jgi:two-component system, NarL family, nitrate/nitrite response regulator NarL
MQWACSNGTVVAMYRTVLIVDDHDGFRTQARALLDAAGYEVVGEAGDGSTGVVEAARLQPDLVLLDVQLPDVSGFEVARRLREDRDRAAIVMISSRDRSDYGARIERSGADGFISKGELSANALRAILEARAS